jgi:hypothetical protein
VQPPARELRNLVLLGGVTGAQGLRLEPPQAPVVRASFGDGRRTAEIAELSLGRRARLDYRGLRTNPEHGPSCLRAPVLRRIGGRRRVGSVDIPR